MPARIDSRTIVSAVCQRAEGGVCAIDATVSTGRKSRVVVFALSLVALVLFATAAAPAFAVKVGDSAAVAQAMAMPKYHSKTLDRDFDVVYFATGVVVNGNQPAVGAEMRELPKNHPPIGSGATTPKVDFSGIKKAAGGKTIAEIFDGKAALGGQSVKVRGKVVKYSANILGKNWLHIRDGTGSEGSNDLVVTTAADAKAGDRVVVSGAVSLNKDFGAGYKYAVIIEDAKVTVE